MHPNAKLIETFYSSFQKLDGNSMAKCYHPDVEFSDPVFPDLKGNEASAMWKMLCSQAKDFTLTFENIEADENTGKAHWEATYNFSKTGKRVHNIIDAKFQFKDGKIIHHKDSFNFWDWSKMALGPVGMLLGWTPLIKNKVQQQAARNLEKYIRRSS
jgi:ketosteroid isomerase-like protein